MIKDEVKSDVKRERKHYLKGLFYEARQATL
jgi:hypothetical protein